MTDLDDVVVDDLRQLRDFIASSPDAESLCDIGLKEVVRGPGAVRTLTAILARRGIDEESSITVFGDTTKMRYQDDDLLEIVTKALSPTSRIEVVQAEPDSSIGTVIADAATVVSAVERVRDTAPRALVSVGSGTVADIGKVIAKELSLTHVVVQTAASVNGFADDQSVLLVNGAKRTTPSRWPEVLVIDPWVVALAPLAMTRSGLGDGLSMFSAAADWYLAKAVGFDASYSPTVISLMRRDSERLFSVAAEIGRGEPDAVSALSCGLALGGMAMGVAGTTSPSSGTEHLISHVLEMRADAEGVACASHGSQVGVASVLASIIWQRVRARLSLGDVDVIETNLANRDRVFDAFSSLDDSGAVAAECWNAYRRKADWIRHHFDDVRAAVLAWPTHDQAIEGLVEPASFIAKELRDALAPVAFHQLKPAPNPEVVAWAVANCHLMRDRFCVLDLVELIGAWGPHDRASALDELRGLSR